MAKFTTLYSGSSGNCAVIEEGGQYLLVDMGCSCRATVTALEAVGLTPDSLAGILVTHEHIDHIRGLEVFLKRHPVPLAATSPTLDALWRAAAIPEATQMLEAEGKTLDIAGFAVTAFSTSHDAAASCGYRIQTPGGALMAIATDLGKMTADVFVHLEGAALVALESNYDREMLRLGRYPASLKRRIASPSGHLSNDACAATVAQLVSAGCRRVALCHLSEENNHPDKVSAAIQAALFECGISQQHDCSIQISRRHQPSPWMDF